MSFENGDLRERLNSRIHDAFGVRPVSGMRFGVELELEGLLTNAHNAVDNREISNWNVKGDGSLVDGLEFLFRSPLTYKQTVTSLQSIQKYLDLDTIVDSIRTSSHVHVNVSDLTLRQTMTFATCYYVLENLLVAWCGENRAGNLFCLRQTDVKAINYAHFKTMSEGYVGLYNDTFRSTALNFRALSNFGTLEFRCMRGITHVDQVIDWVNIIKGIYEVALTYDNPALVIYEMSAGGIDVLIDAIIKDERFRAELKAIPNYAALVLESVQATQFWATCVNFDRLDNSTTEKKRKSRSQ